jgi:Tfp pilus assembly protein PilF
MTDGAERLLTKAIELHQRGDLAQAEGLYRQVLQAVPAHLDGLNLLGVLAIQTGRHELAAELIGKAIAANDKVADFHNNMGEHLRRDVSVLDSEIAVKHVCSPSHARGVGPSRFHFSR